MTVIMQSSSAAVATTLTALHTGAVSFEQAASLVIGAAVGTTVTGALAAIGGSVPARRTALAHIVFNLATGLVAVALLPLFLRGIAWAQEQAGLDPGATSLAAFHSAFIALGVLLFLPWVHPFARAIERLLPDRGPVLTRHLDDTLLHAPPVALEASRRALSETSGELFHLLQAVLAGEGGPTHERQKAELARAGEQIQNFFARIPPMGEDEPLSRSRLAQMHAIDHLLRLLSRIEPPAGVSAMLRHERMRPAVECCRDILVRGAAGLRGEAPPDWPEVIKAGALELADLRRRERPAVLRQTAVGVWKPGPALEVLDAMRWLDRIGYHAWRIANYLAGDGSPESEATPEPAHPDA